VNRIIQDLTTFAVNEGICIRSAEDVRGNDELMNLIVSSWNA
jgi:hypothetical protein